MALDYSAFTVFCRVELCRVSLFFQAMAQGGSAFASSFIPALVFSSACVLRFGFSGA